MKSFGGFAGKLLWLVLFAFMPGIQTGSSQNRPQSGLYQIISGHYSYWGFGTQLPNPTCAFIELNVVPSSRISQMRILAQDMKTVLSIPPEPCGREVLYFFTNGTMFFTDTLRFYKPPPSLEPTYYFVISNSLGKLSLNGNLVAGCNVADAPYQFYHDHVLAVLMPVLTVRIGANEVELCWSTVSNRTYQLQYRSNWTTNEWTDLGPRVTGTGTTNCIGDQLPLGQPQRFYRVLTLHD